MEQPSYKCMNLISCKHPANSFSALIWGGGVEGEGGRLLYCNENLYK